MCMYQSVIRHQGGTQNVSVIAGITAVNGSVLLVPADTVAFFVCNGHVSEPYMPGRWEIRTGVNPFFVRFRNFMTQGDPGVTCQVWWVNTCQENCKSGGTGDLIFQEQRFHISMKARASYTIRYVISDPLVFISKLVGMHRNEFDTEDVQPAIDAMLMPYIKQTVITCISANSVHEFQNDLISLGRNVRSFLAAELQEYGINLTSVAITAVNIPDGELKRLNELEEKYAKGTVETDIEVDNVRRVYGSLENRTLTEVVTGTARGHAMPLSRETSGVAGMMATLPIQMSIANQMVSQMSGNLGNMMSGNPVATNGNTSSFHGARPNPPDLPVRKRRCANCNRELECSDVYCRYCGNRL